ncbi:MAG: hypothetical protein K6C68_13230 [Ruminococcus sp.]|nr:hypothetical protein [Ruminococcus sp.]
MSKGINTEVENGELLPDDDLEFEREYAEQQRKRQQEIIENRRRIAEEKRKREKQEREERDRRIAQDKLDLVKMKAGIADEQETIKEKHEEERVLSFGEKAANFWYHEKMWIILALFAAAVVTFMIIDTVRREKPDLEILLICDNALALDDQRVLLEDKLEQYVPDRNGDGKVCVSILNCALNENKIDIQYNNNSQKFYANLQQGSIIMVITDSNTDPDLQALMVNDLPDRFPDNKYVDEDGLSLNFGFLADELQCEKLPNDIHLCMRRPVSTLDGNIEDMQKNFDEDLEVFTAIAEGLAEQASASGDKGLPTDPVPFVSASAASADTDSKTGSEQ